MNVNDVNMVKIAINKSLLREYKLNKERVVYLDNGSEFQIQFFNPYDFSVAADIYLNGTKIPNRLVLRPGERVWLERYLDKSTKFKFETYDVELDKETGDLVKKAIKNNGLVKVSFHQEENKAYEPLQLICDSPTVYYKTSYLNSPAWQENQIRLGGGTLDYYASSCGCDTTVLGNSAVNVSSISFDYNVNTTATNIVENTSNKRGTKIKETGRVSEGGWSGQQVKNVYENFTQYVFHTEEIKILPMSEKMFSANDLQKKYCTECGHKLSPKHKYCPNCGTKVN